MVMLQRLARSLVAAGCLFVPASVPKAQPACLAFALLTIAAVTSLHARQLTLPGKVTVPEAAPLPPGSLLRVSLHDLTPGVPRTATVARASMNAAGASSSIRFELPYEDQLVEADRLYGVAAVITDARGLPVWETRVPIRVLTMGNQKSVSLSLWPAEQPKASPEPTSFSVVCEALRLEVRLDGSTATVVASDSTVVLQRADTPFGKRYSDGTTTLVVLGEAAYFQGPRRAYRDCLVSLPSGDR